jgi:hypothetical protein
MEVVPLWVVNGHNETNFTEWLNKHGVHARTKSEPKKHWNK